MTKEEIYSIWAPEDSIWSPWVKPVLFAHMDDHQYPTEEFAKYQIRVRWAPAPEAKIAIILDLPGDESVYTALALAEKGYCPVPLFNALPHPYGSMFGPTPGGAGVAVNVAPIIHALRSGSLLLENCLKFKNPPPAFLLDFNRHGGYEGRRPGDFDNRSVCFTTDFPSPTFLQAHGINGILLAHLYPYSQPLDLSHVLFMYKEAGIGLRQIRLDAGVGIQPLEIKKPSWFGAMFQRVLITKDFRRAPGNGFGSWIPHPSSGG